MALLPSAAYTLSRIFIFLNENFPRKPTVGVHILFGSSHPAIGGRMEAHHFAIFIRVFNSYIG